LTDKDRLIYLEAVTRIKEKALFPPPAVTSAQTLPATLKSYLTQKDPSSGYLTREEYREFQRLQGDEYVGIGLELERDHRSNILCFPDPGSAAEKAGIRSRDRLVRIRGVSLAGKSLLEVVSLARGTPGTKIDLVVSTPNGHEKRITLTRHKTPIQTVSKRYFESVPFIQLRTFTPHTKAKLETLVADWPKDEPLIIDLRGNRGGDLHAAVDSAKLFLPRGAPIVSIKGRGSQHYKNDLKAVNTQSPLYLWQDETTASAAEIFIAALVENRRARSVGTQTFGKGTKQDIIELSDGSALILTTGHLLTPSGVHYDGRGLVPTDRLLEDVYETAHYFTRVRSLVQSRRLPPEHSPIQ
jgi:carboxyl-terminal processing protease